MYALCVSGAVNTQGFVWKFLCAICTFSFIHSYSDQSLVYVLSQMTDIYSDLSLVSVLSQLSDIYNDLSSVYVLSQLTSTATCRQSMS